MSIDMVFSLFGGLGLFIYGMKLMSDGLQKTAGKKLKDLLGMLTTNRFTGLLVGTLVTAVIQSSSATTVMVVGFVNAGLMTLRQSIGVIMGANIGTTVTAQLIAFNLSHYAIHAIAIGAALFLFGKKDRTQQIGQVVLGFGVLFLGMSVMKETMEPLKDSHVFLSMMKQFNTSPLLGLVAGAVITCIIQSSSASIGIVLSLLSVGAMDFAGAVPVLLGCNIGTTITAILSSIGANRTAKQAAAVHFIFNLLGSVIVLALIYIIPDFMDMIYNGIYRLTTGILRATPTNERLLANAHTMFNVINTIIWIPFVNFLVWLVGKIVPGKDIVIERGLKYLDERMLETPSFAINQLKAEVLRMYDIAVEMFEETVKAFRKYDLELVKYVENKEDIINELEEELVKFITKFPRHSMSKYDIRVINMYFAIIDDIESFADDSEEIAELLRFTNENAIEFSEEALETVEKCFQYISEMVEDTKSLIKHFDIKTAEKILASEISMDRYQIENRNGHIERLGKGICDPNAGIIYLEVLDALEHISDQMADITHSILEARGLK
ncbi:MAG: Na/Pi cotransporter family protein [Halanaerobiaceae bacterium]|nr:Na/Pi cotransporter family protein [Halanaerobiaceae bacterium]